MATYSRLFLILISLWGFANAMFRPANYLDAQLAMLLPSQIRLIINGYARDHSTSISDSSISHYEFRLQWVEPYKWGDEGDTKISSSDFELAKKRRYEIHCWMETDGGKHVRDLLNSAVPYRLSFQEYVERRVEISDIDEFADDFYVQCGIRVRNALDARTVYSYSNTIRMKQVPVYFRGYEGLNLRAFSIDDFLTLKKNTEILLGDEELAEEEETRRKSDGGENGTEVGNKSIGANEMQNGSHWEISNGIGRSDSNDTGGENLNSTARENLNTTERTLLNSTLRTSTNPPTAVFSNSTKSINVRLNSTSTDSGRLDSSNSTDRVISNSTSHQLLNATDHELLNSTSETLNATNRGLMDSTDRGFSNATKGILHSSTDRPILNSTAGDNLNSTLQSTMNSTDAETSRTSVHPPANRSESAPSISTSTSPASSHGSNSKASILPTLRSSEPLSRLPTISNDANSTTQPATNATTDSTPIFENSTTQSDDRYNATATPLDSTNAPSFAAHEILSKMVKSTKESFTGTFYGLRAMSEGFRRTRNGTVGGMTNGTIYG